MQAWIAVLKIENGDSKNGRKMQQPLSSATVDRDSSDKNIKL